MRRIVFTGSIALSLIVVAACSSSGEPTRYRVGAQSSPIIGGSADTTHQAIMALISDVGGGGYTECTGTVFKVDPDGTGWLVTAAHCTLGDAQTPNPTSANTTVHQGNHYNSASKTYPVISLAHHPMYVAPGNTDGQYDVGIVHFSGASASTPVIPITGANDGLATGQTIQIYGYGLTVHPPQSDNNDTRNTVAKPISQLTSLLVHHNDSNGKGTCEGDSGGPSIVVQGGTEVVVAVTSYGDQTCSSDAGATRLSAALTWIESVAGGTSTGAGGSSGTGAGGTGTGATTGAGGGGGGGLDCNTPGGQIGCCNGGTSVSFCMNGAIQTNDCMGMGCGWDSANGYYDCTFSGADPAGTYPLDCGGGSSTTQGGGGQSTFGAGGTGAGPTGAGAGPGAGGTGTTTTGAGAGPGAGGTGTTTTGAGAGPGAGGTGTTTTGAGAGPGAGPGPGAGGTGQGAGTGAGTGGAAQGPTGAGPATGTGGSAQTTTGAGGATTAGGGGHPATTGQGGTFGNPVTGQGGTFGTTGQGGGIGFGAGGAIAPSSNDVSADNSDSTVGSSGGCQTSGGGLPNGALLLALFALPLMRRRRNSAG